MSAVTRWVDRLHDFDAIVEASKAWDIDFRLLGAGDGRGEVEAVATRRAIVQRNRLGWKLHQRGASPSGSCTFGLGVDAGQDFPWCGRHARDDWLLFFPVNGEYDSVSDESFHGYSLTFDEGLVRETAHLLGGPSDVEPGSSTGVFNVGRERAAALRGMVRGIMRAARSRPDGEFSEALARAIEQDLLPAILRAFADGQPAKPPTSRLRSLAVRRSTEFIEQVGGRPVTVRELCEVSGVSWRTLDYAFKDHFGVSPKKYLTVLRLNSAHQDLLASRPGEKRVDRIGARWGFWHMGRFARDYRRLFGELPSETLHGGRTRAAK